MHVIIGLEVGGAEHMLHRLVLAQQEDSAAIECTVVSLTDEGPLGLQLSKDGIDVFALGMRSPLGLVMVVWRLRSLILQRRPNVVQTWMPHGDLLGGLAARWAGIRNVVWGIRATTMTGASRATRLMRRLCALLSHAIPAHIVSAAEASQRSHIAIGYDASRMSVIPNGFDVHRFKPDSSARQFFNAEFRIDKTHVLIGHAGRWDSAKDHLGFVKAAGEVARRMESCRFLMMGRGIDESNESLIQAIQSTGYADRFVLIGERQDMPYWLGAMDIFCLSSRTEGFPNVVGEAMACAVPCVVTDVGDARLIVGDTGWVVPPEDPHAMADALCAAALVPPQQRQARGLSARERIVHEFSMERAVQRFDALYKKVAEETQRKTV
jgi:glycosyltransferase involved in cell wall biosynthesis